jgi:hypothetical protein
VQVAFRLHGHDPLRIDARKAAGPQRDGEPKLKGRLSRRPFDIFYAFDNAFGTAQPRSVIHLRSPPMRQELRAE